MAGKKSLADREAGDDISMVAVAGHDIAFDVSLARRILRDSPREPTKFRLTADGRETMVGARAEGQRAADAAVPGIVGSVDDLIVVLDGRARMDAAEGMPRFFPVYALTRDETARCVAPTSRRAFQRLLKTLRTPAI